MCQQRRCDPQKDHLVLFNKSRECGDCFFKDACASKDAAIIRVEHADRFFGLLAVLLAPDVTVDDEEKELLQEVAGDIGLALHNMELKESRRQAEKELAKYRDHLEVLVKERTRDLEVAQEELIKREKLSVLGQLTATVSHEIRNPLGVIRSSAFYLQRKIGGAVDEKTAKHLNRIEEQVSLCDTIVGDLLEYTRGRSSEAIHGESM
jgi:signal transduction histidine kinase